MSKIDATKQSSKPLSKRFSFGLFSSKNKVSRALLPDTQNVTQHVVAPKPVQTLKLLDDKIFSQSFGDLDIDCSSFISLPAAEAPQDTPLPSFSRISTSSKEPDNGPAQPNHANSHSHSILHSLSRRSSTKKLRSPSFSKKKEGWYEDFRVLEQEYHKFTSKTGVHKANVLRLAVLPFLRQQRGEFFKATPAESARRARILQKWWAGALGALRDREKAVSGPDRSAYLEAISGIVSRREWADQPAVYQELLLDTISYIIAKLSLKTVPITFAAFAGKVLAYGYFHAPGVAPALLQLLHVQDNDIERLLAVSFETTSHEFTDLKTAADILQQSFPPHLSPLIACTSVPSGPSSIPNIYGPWSRRWTSFNSDVFYSFFKHFYTIISQLMPAELPKNAHLAAPGLIIIHAFLLNTLDSVVHPRKSK